MRSVQQGTDHSFTLHFGIFGVCPLFISKHGLQKEPLMRGILIVLFLASFSDSQAASFDCAKARTGAEKLICSDSLVSALDNALDEEYELVSTTNSDEENISLKTQQKAWLATRNKCPDASCLQRAYETRIKQLACSSKNIGSAIGALKCFGLRLREAESIVAPLEHIYTNSLIASSNNPGRAKALTVEERKKWIEYRDAYCEMFGETEGGSDGWKNAWAASCAVEETEKRIAILKKKLKSDRSN